MPETEAPRGQSLLVGCAHCAIVVDIGRVHVGSQGRDQRMEDVGRESHQWWQTRVGVGE